MGSGDIKYINPRRWLTGVWIPEWLLHHPQISPGAKLLYAELASLFNAEEGCAWPSIPYLAEQLHCSEREIQKQIRELVDAGVLEVEPGGGREPNRYRFPVPPGTVHPSGAVTPGATGGSPPPGIVHPTGERAFTPPVNGRSPQEPVENSANSSTTRLPAVRPVGDQIYLPNLKNKEKGGKVLSPPPQSLPPLAVLWNEMVPSPKVLRVSGTRARHVSARMKTYPDLGWWAGVIQRLLATPFLRGQNERGWVADFDWLVKNDENPVRVLEGKYDRAARVTMRARAAEIEKNLARIGGGEEHD